MITATFSSQAADGMVRAWPPNPGAIDTTQNRSYCTSSRDRPNSRLWKLPELRKSINDASGDFFLMISTSSLNRIKRPIHSYHSLDGGIEQPSETRRLVD